MTSSSPNFLSSFDPALHLHSEEPEYPLHPPSESFSDDLEAIHSQRRELTRRQVVIQHRAWDLSDVFRSEDDLRPGKGIPCARLYAAFAKSSRHSNQINPYNSAGSHAYAKSQNPSSAVVPSDKDAFYLISRRVMCWEPDQRDT